MPSKRVLLRKLSADSAQGGISVLAAVRNHRAECAGAPGSDVGRMQGFLCNRKEAGRRYSGATAVKIRAGTCKELEDPEHSRMAAR